MTLLGFYFGSARPIISNTINLYQSFPSFLPRPPKWILVVEADAGQPLLVFVASKDIAIGDELLFDYNDRESRLPFLKSCPICDGKVYFTWRFNAVPNDIKFRSHVWKHLMDGLLHLVQRGGDWAGSQLFQAPRQGRRSHRSTFRGKGERGDNLGIIHISHIALITPLH